MAKRRRWPWVLGGILVLLAVLVVAAELIARAVLPGAVRGLIIEQLELPADQQIEVEAAGLLVPQLLSGSLDTLEISSESVTLAGVTGAVDVVAQDVALDGSNLGAASGTVRIHGDQFVDMLGAFPIQIDTVSLAEPNVTFETALSMFGLSVPIALTVLPGADGGDVLLSPVSISVGGAELTATEVIARLGEFGETLTQPQHICIREWIPAGLAVTDISIDGSDAVIRVDVDGAIVSDKSLQLKGTCD